MWYFLTVIYDGYVGSDDCGPICNPFGFGQSIFPMNNSKQKLL